MRQVRFHRSLLLILAFAPAAASQAETWDAGTPVVEMEPSDQGTGSDRLALEVYPAFAYGDEGEFATLSVGVDRRLHDTGFSIAPQLVLGAARNTDEETVGVYGFDLMGRYHFTEPLSAASPLGVYLEAGAGLQYTGPTSLPRTGTHLNFRLRAGAGAAYRLTDRCALLGGVNWFHVSNGNLLTPNNGHDGPLFYLGLRMGF